jgi:hypothetical protein
MAVMTELRAIFSDVEASIAEAALTKKVETRIPEATVGQIGVVLRHYDRTRVIELVNGVVRPGPAFPFVE